MIINQNITNEVLFMASLGAGLSSGLLSGLVLWLCGFTHAVAVGFTMGLLCLFLAASLFRVVDSAMAALFVLYATDPAVLHQKYQALGQEIQRVRGDAYEQE